MIRDGEQTISGVIKHLVFAERHCNICKKTTVIKHQCIAKRISISYHHLSDSASIILLPP